MEQNTLNAGGGYVEIGGEQLIVRATTRVTTLEEIAKLPLKFTGAVKPMMLSEVATVGIGSGFRTGASTDDGREALVGATIMLVGENSRLVAQAVREKLAEIQEKLPAGVVIRPLYDRSDLVNRTIATVERNLAEGALLVVVVLIPPARQLARRPHRRLGHSAGDANGHDRHGALGTEWQSDESGSHRFRPHH